MKVSVFLQSQNPASGETAPHRCSRTFASLLSAQFPHLVRYSSKDSTLQLKTKEGWASVKARLRPKTSTGTVTELLPPGPDGPLMLSYPPAPRESDGKRRQRALWMGATKF